MFRVMKSKGETRALARFLVQRHYEDLTASAIEHTKRCVLDYLGVTIAGSAMENSKLLAYTVKEWGGAEESTVVGHPFKLPAPSAGLVNGASGHAIQMDDTEWITVAHLGTAVIPAALAVAEKQGNVNGKELIRAIVLGYEAAIRIGAAVNPSHNQRGFSPNGTLGVFGAAIAAGMVLHLDEEKIADSIGSAAMQSSGLEQFCYDGSMSAILNTGHATQAGIISAILAQRGFTGSREILEGKSGFCRAYSDTYNLEKILEDFNGKFGIEDVWFKRYPTCAYCNSTLDIVINLKEQHQIDPDNVKEVLVKTFSVVENTVNNPFPENETAAMLSMPYSVAMALREGKVTPYEFKNEGWRDSEVKQLMEKVKLVVADKELIDAGYELNRGSFVEIKCKDDSHYKGEAKAPRGDPIDPLTNEEITEKYQVLSRYVFGKNKVEAIAEVVWRLEDVDDVQQLATLLNSQ